MCSLVDFFSTIVAFGALVENMIGLKGGLNLVEMSFCNNDAISNHSSCLIVLSFCDQYQIQGCLLGKNQSWCAKLLHIEDIVYRLQMGIQWLELRRL